MLFKRRKHAVVLLVAILAMVAGVVRTHAQAALLMEEPYGFFGTVNPTGHNAVYFARICAETPVELRRCKAGEQGVVISRYQGIDGYDWVAIPLIPYLYSVDDASEVPQRVDKATVHRLRNLYHESHLEELGADVPQGNFWRGGWTQLVGAGYERRIYAFRFETTEDQDDAVIERLNSDANRSHFNLFYNNCANFAISILNVYFPHTFRREFFPDVGMTTPKEIASKLVHYAKKHPETKLEVFEIPQIPGYRRKSGSNKTVTGSLMTTAYAIPIAVASPYLAGGLFVDYLARGHEQPVPKHPDVLTPERLSLLNSDSLPTQNPESTGTQAASTAARNLPPIAANTATGAAMKVNVATHE